MQIISLFLLIFTGNINPELNIILLGIRYLLLLFSSSLFPLTSLVTLLVVMITLINICLIQVYLEVALR